MNDDLAETLTRLGVEARADLEAIDAELARLTHQRDALGLILHGVELLEASGNLPPAEPEPAFPCPECDRTDLANAAGLAVHRRVAHGVVSAATQRAEDRDGRRETDEAQFQCGKCERTFLSAAGLGRHRKSCTSTAAMPPLEPEPAPEPSIADLAEATPDPTDAEIAEVMAGAERESRSRYRFTGEHLIERREGRPEYRLHCACRWVTLAADDEAEAVAMFRTHVAEMTAARSGLDPTREIMQAAVDDEDDWIPPVPSIATGAHPVHRLGEKRRKGHDHIAACSCGWASDPCVLASEAADALAAHIAGASLAMEVA